MAAVISGEENYGTIKIRDANGYLHEILHTNTQSVVKGQKITAGDPIGTMGGWGPMKLANQYPIHVHYQMRDRNGKIINPQEWWDSGYGDDFSSNRWNNGNGDAPYQNWGDTYGKMKDNWDKFGATPTDWGSDPSLASIMKGPEITTAGDFAACQLNVDIAVASRQFGGDALEQICDFAGNAASACGSYTMSALAGSLSDSPFSEKEGLSA